MAFANSNNGDIKSLNHILQTLDTFVGAIPGVTCAAGLSKSVDAEEAYYFTRSASTVAKTTAGSQLSFTSGGCARVSIPMTDAITVSDVIPMVNYATVSDDVIADRVVYDTIGVANKYNEEFIGAVSATTTSFSSTTAMDADKIYGMIVDAITEFEVINKARYMSPTAIIVGPTAKGLLLKCPQFTRAGALGDSVVTKGVIGEVLGLPVVYFPGLDETTAKLDFIMVNAEGVGAPISVNAMKTVDATSVGYVNGVAIAGEFTYGFKIADANLVIKKVHA